MDVFSNATNATIVRRASGNPSTFYVNLGSAIVTTVIGLLGLLSVVRLIVLMVSNSPSQDPSASGIRRETSRSVRDQRSGTSTTSFASTVQHPLNVLQTLSLWFSGMPSSWPALMKLYVGYAILPFSFEYIDSRASTIIILFVVFAAAVTSFVFLHEDTARCLKTIKQQWRHKKASIALIRSQSSELLTDDAAERFAQQFVEDHGWLRSTIPTLLRNVKESLRLKLQMDIGGRPDGFMDATIRRVVRQATATQARRIAKALLSAPVAVTQTDLRAICEREGVSLSTDLARELIRSLSLIDESSDGSSGRELQVEMLSDSDRAELLNGSASASAEAEYPLNVDEMREKMGVRAVILDRAATLRNAEKYPDCGALGCVIVSARLTRKHKADFFQNVVEVTSKKSVQHLARLANHHARFPNADTWVHDVLETSGGPLRDVYFKAGAIDTLFEAQHQASYALKILLREPLRCPLHAFTLIIPNDDHRVVMDADGISPFMCPLMNWHWFHEAQNVPACNQEKFVVCPKEGCRYVLCESCLQRESWLAQKRVLFATFIARLVRDFPRFATLWLIYLTFFLYVPVSKIALSVVFCTSQTESRFEGCFNVSNDTFLFYVAFALASLVCLALVMGQPAAWLITVLCRRHWIVKLRIAKTAREWQRFLISDDSAGSVLYSNVKRRYMYFEVILFMFASALVCSVVFAEADSNEQLIAVATITSARCIIVTFVHGYSSIYVELLAKANVTHNSLQLALLSWYRAYESEWVPWAMLSVVAAFFVLYLTVVLAVLLIPMLFGDSAEDIDRDERHLLQQPLSNAGRLENVLERKKRMYGERSFEVVCTHARLASCYRTYRRGLYDTEKTFEAAPSNLQIAAANCITMFAALGLSLGTPLKDVRIYGARVCNVDFKDVSFVGADLRNVDFRGCRFVGCDFTNALIDEMLVGKITPPTIRPTFCHRTTFSPFRDLPVQCKGFAVSASGTKLFALNSDRIDVVDAYTGDVLNALTGDAISANEKEQQPAAFSLRTLSQHHHIQQRGICVSSFNVVCSWTTTHLFFWDVDLGLMLLKHSWEKEHDIFIHSAQWSPSGQSLAVFMTSIVRVLHISNHGGTITIEQDHECDAGGTSSWSERPAPVLWSGNGRLLFVPEVDAVSKTAMVSVVDVERRYQRHCQLEGCFLAASPDGHHMCWCYNRTTSLVDLSNILGPASANKILTPTRICNFPASEASMAFSPDGRQSATSSPFMI